MGKPVALEARAEERDVRGLISMMTTRPVLGSCANWTLVPPMTPMASTILKAILVRRSMSSGAMVSMGAAQKESPVWTPTGSMFSMVQTQTIWFLASRTTSISSSSQPLMDSSTRIWWVMERSRPLRATVSSSSMLYAKPPPAPPIV